MRMEDWSNARKRRIIKQTSETTSEGIKVSLSSADRKSDVYSTLVWTSIYHTSKICGLFPIKFTQNESGKYSGQSDKLQVVYGIFLVLAFIGCQSWGLYRDSEARWERIEKSPTTTTITATCIDVFAALSTTVIIILSSSYRWGHLKCVIDKLVDVDEKLNIATSTNLRKSIIIFISCTYAWVVLVCFLDFIASPVFNDPLEAFNYTPLYSMYFIIYTFGMQYALVLFNIAERFVKLNKSILNMTKGNFLIGYLRKDMGLAAIGSRKKGSQTISSNAAFNLGQSQHRRANTAHDLMNSGEGTIDTSEMIENLTNVHGILCDCVTEVNKAYGFGILSATISCLIHLVITLYFLYYAVYNNNEHWWLLVFWTVFHFYRLLLFVQPCYLVVLKLMNIIFVALFSVWYTDSVVHRARMIGSLISQALANDWIPNTRIQLELFSIQLLQRPIEFTACGIFFLNRGLLTTILGSVTTYLAIMVQFQAAVNDTVGTKNLLENASFYLKNNSRFNNHASHN